MHDKLLVIMLEFVRLLKMVLASSIGNFIQNVKNSALHLVFLRRGIFSY